MIKNNQMMGHKPINLLSKVTHVKIILPRPRCHARKVPHHPHIKQKGGASSPQHHQVHLKGQTSSQMYEIKLLKRDVLTKEGDVTPPSSSKALSKC